jgi:NAD(P)H-hydrate epimerase
MVMNPTGNSGMASGGSGDVLTGMIGSFLAQGLDTFSASALSVYLHGLAGDLAADEVTEYSLVAGDIMEYIPLAFKECLGEFLE